MLLDIQKEDQMKQLSSRLDSYTQRGNHVFLNYAHWCGACQMFMPQWSLFEKLAVNNGVSIVKIESSGLSSLPYTNSSLYSKLSNSGQMYFPMVFMYVNGKRYFYEGPRTAEALQSFYQKKVAENAPKKAVGAKKATATTGAKKVAKSPSSTKKASAPSAKKKIPSARSLQQTIDKFMKMKMV